MILRVLLAPDRAALGRRFQRLLEPADLLVETLPRRTARAWDRLARWSGDLALVSRSIIPPPLPDALKIWRDVPDRPEVVVLADREDPVERAQLDRPPA